MKTWMAFGLVVVLAGVAVGAEVDSVPGTRWNLPVMATWTEDPATGVTLAFERAEAGSAWLEFGPAEQAWKSEVAHPSPSYRHVFQLEGLTPGQIYSYRVSASDGYAQNGTFRTAPMAGDGGTPFSFVWHGDLQGGLNMTAGVAVAEAIVANEPDRLFVLSTGDLGDNRYSTDYLDCVRSWEKFFACTSNELAGTVFQPCVGNHDEPENPDSFWYRLFELPGDKRDYVFDVGPLRFICVDSAEFEIPSRTPWLRRQLQAAASDERVRWVIPVFHRPPYSWGEREGQQQVRDNWCALFTRYEVPLVLSGHAHTYQRTQPIDGVNYLVSGGGGAWLYEIDEKRPEICMATTCYHYVRFDVGTDGTLSLTAKTPDGKVFDQFTYAAPRRRVRTSPAFPHRGETLTVTYDPADGPLSGAEKVCIKAGADDWRNIFLDNAEMEALPDGRFQISFEVPIDPKWHISYCFHDPERDLWDNNLRHDWQTLLAPQFQRD
jgi:hypothetical protein